MSLRFFFSRKFPFLSSSSSFSALLHHPFPPYSVVPGGRDRVAPVEGMAGKTNCSADGHLLKVEARPR